MKTEGRPFKDSIAATENLELILEVINDDLLDFNAFTPMNLNEFPYIDFNMNEYLEILSSEEEIPNPPPSPPSQQIPTDQIEAQNEQPKEETEATPIEETTDDSKGYS